MRGKGQCFIMFHQVQTWRAICTDSSLKEGSLIQSREQLSCRVIVYVIVYLIHDALLPSLRLNCLP